MLSYTGSTALRNYATLKGTKEKLQFLTDFLKVSVLKSESPTPSTISDCHTSPPASLMEDPATPEPSSHDKEELEQTKSKNASDVVQPSTTLPMPQKSSSFLTDLPPLGRGQRYIGKKLSNADKLALVKLSAKLWISKN